MFGNKWWSTKVGTKLMSDLVIFSILSSDFHDSIWVVPVKYLMYFLTGKNTEQFWNIHEEKYFAPLRILNLFIKYFVNHFVDISLTFFDSSFNWFLFDVASFSLLSKSVLFTKLALPLLLAKFARFNLKAKSSPLRLLNSGVVIYLSWLWSVISISAIFVLQSVFLTKLLTLGALFSTAIKH